MKNLFAALLFLAQVASAIWLAVTEGLASGVMFFVTSTIIISVLLTFHDDVSRLFSPPNR